jgi:hypothetical protein
MHEYLDLAAETGYFDDPRILYDLTPAEIAITIAGKAARDRQQQQMENVRAGDGCGRGLQLAPAETDGPGVDLERYLPGHDAKTAAVAGGDETTMQRDSTDIRRNGDDAWR